VKIYFVAPEVVRMGDDIKDFLTSRDVSWEESDDLAQVSSSLPPAASCTSPLPPLSIYQILTSQLVTDKPVIRNLMDPPPNYDVFGSGVVPDGWRLWAVVDLQRSGALMGEESAGTRGIFFGGMSASPCVADQGLGFVSVTLILLLLAFPENLCLWSR